jgi:hypothetical protein
MYWKRYLFFKHLDIPALSSKGKKLLFGYDIFLCNLNCCTISCKSKLLACDIPGNTTGGSITVPLTSCFTGLDLSVLQIKTKIVSCHTSDSKPVKQEVNGTVILPPLVFPGYTYQKS